MKRLFLCPKRQKTFDRLTQRRQGEKKKLYFFLPQTQTEDFVPGRLELLLPPLQNVFSNLVNIQQSKQEDKHDLQY